MSEQNLIDQHPLKEAIADILREIEQTPEEYWPNLLQMITLFRETVTMKTRLSNDPGKTVEQKISIDERIQKTKEQLNYCDRGKRREMNRSKPKLGNTYVKHSMKTVFLIVPFSHD